MKMLKHAYYQGVKEVVSTIHFQHPLFTHINHSLVRFQKIKKFCTAKTKRRRYKDKNSSWVWKFIIMTTYKNYQRASCYYGEWEIHFNRV